MGHMQRLRNIGVQGEYAFMSSEETIGPTAEPDNIPKVKRKNADALIALNGVKVNVRSCTYLSDLDTKSDAMEFSAANWTANPPPTTRNRGPASIYCTGKIDGQARTNSFHPLESMDPANAR